MSVEDQMASSFQPTRRHSIEESNNAGYNVVPSTSSRRSFLKKRTGVSVYSLHNPTTPNATTPSTVNLSPSVSHDRPASWKSQDARSSSSSVSPSLEPADSIAKKLRFRGSRLFKRPHSKTNPPSLRTLYWVTDSQFALNNSLEHWSSLHRVSQHNRMHSTGSKLSSTRMLRDHGLRSIRHWPTTTDL